MAAAQHRRSLKSAPSIRLSTSSPVGAHDDHPQGNPYASLGALTAIHPALAQARSAALGFILIVVAAISLAAINRLAGTKVGGLFG